MAFRLFAQTGASIRSLPLESVLILGGKSSSGLALEKLKAADDYVLISCKDGKVHIHPLKGKKAQPRTLLVMEWVEIEDLKFFVVQEESLASETHLAGFFSDLQTALARLKNAKSVEKTFLELLNVLLQTLGMKKGLVITRSSPTDLEVLLQVNVTGQDQWLSETIVHQTFESRAPVFVGHVLNSDFSSSKSLVGSGISSVITLPLIVRNEVIGVCLLGSDWPHSGLNEKTEGKVQLLTDLMSMLLDDHLRERALTMKLNSLALAKTRPMLSASAGMNDVLKLAEKIAPTNISVLVQGETGAGKEGVAKWIHECSERKTGPFIAVNCGAIPGELLESLLFGHVKGAFTGAHQDQPGRIRQAHGGTLFLDEIGDLPPALQAKLLRFLQERRVEPLGGKQSFPVDVRLVAASNKPLNDMVAGDLFRSDLFFRLAEVTLSIPPLRERRDDILLLAQHFLNEFAPQKTFHYSALNWLMNESWPGNVRELSSAIRRAAVLASGPELMPADFLVGAPLLNDKSTEHSDWRTGESLEEAKTRFCHGVIRQALQKSGGHRQKAADSLGITSRTLFRYLEEMKVESLDMTEMSDTP